MEKSIVPLMCLLLYFFFFYIQLEVLRLVQYLQNLQDKDFGDVSLHN